MQLQRRARRMAAISIVPLVDVLLILLVFFMVTSTYLDLDMIPVLDPGEPATAAGEGGASGTILIRIASGGRVYAGGREQTPQSLSEYLTGRIAADPDLRVLILPSARADVQTAVRTMDIATLAGVREVGLARLEAR